MVHPLGRQHQVLEQRAAIVGWQRAPESGDPFWCDVLRTEVTERLDDEAGRTAGSRIVPASVWRRSAEVMAGRLATSRKWRGVKTHPLPCPLMRSSIDFSVDC